MNANLESLSVDDEIFSCLDLDKPKSFFLFAGAGSGKTRSLVEVLKKFRDKNINRLKKKGQKVAIITYTNAACDEIKRRLEFDSSFEVSTIHSFAWDLISTYRNDIRSWLQNHLQVEIADLKDKQSRAKNTNTKTYIDRQNKIESKTNRLDGLEAIKKFTYNPNGDNTSIDSLNHSEVISIAAQFIENNALMQNILVRKFPILLIDESQDTKKELIDAFFKVQTKNSGHFSLGMFGDTMQRIYNDGKENLGENIPEDWAKPEKQQNHRCPRRVIKLINKIREDVDGQAQESVKETEGHVRFFIVDTTGSVDKASAESNAANQMKIITEDENWDADQGQFKILTLEHHMAAKRGSFSNFFEPLYAVDKFKTGILDGTLPGITLFANHVLPLVDSIHNKNRFKIASIIKHFSPLLTKEQLRTGTNSIDVISKANEAVNYLLSLWSENQDPSLAVILKEIYRSNLFNISDSLIPIADRLNNDPSTIEDDDSDKDETIEAWEKALMCPFSEFERYVQYISDKSRFGTHQGIKGLEFPRVMVILDDEDARGFLFSYEKLFGAKELTQNDLNNIKDGKETGVDRTRRLFYVTCSRAEQSLAIVAFTQNPKQVENYVLSQDWFQKDEIIHINESV